MGLKSDLYSNFDYEIVDEFLDHYSLMVDAMEVMILDLSKPNMYEQSVNELFRVFHNIKSASSYLQIAPMSKLSTFVEDILEEMRKNYSCANEETINWLLSIDDMFTVWKNDIRLDKELSHIKYSLLKLPDLDNN
ncbi:MAG: chemotaxis protein CheA [Sulfurimonas sp. RIFOXYD12_FULL_33_39]|uniref:chemotaxis protein CheA n=1 Tax=unclassified Sulfurimonas TaxID=2623549 RepID=UPI0008C24EDB|nr:MULTISPECIES: chemotaxis protein CheA [unclassified Sulfurimonas]OHE00853.1 MAG: chemotaxis protein CheA [Sulfurimonas sp. RIFCSPLOWO2_12_FULL_34_6]OHE10525.1 MAG: chemotaxis protein CheA [Sulfurimonas sp. RIFOXYD12_FULL_33_39]OHE14984.1 MAG: chemotaxis protein CheA [Sulfurimonas sp. RIFOXYD2_FULL_34_21]DAB27742.1 MAG TPA: chemotaxis protein CheA [Sulfurimonas sp. UBA10385]